MRCGEEPSARMTKDPEKSPGKALPSARGAGRLELDGLQKQIETQISYKWNMGSNIKNCKFSSIKSKKR